MNSSLESKFQQSLSSKTVGAYLLDRLHQLGVKHIFGIPGDYVIRFDKLIEEHPIEFINTTRENTAGFMADAYARCQGLGVACITYGVGINIANAVSQAYAESSPVVLISGAAGTEEMLQGEKLHHVVFKASSANPENTQLEIFKHITVDQAVLSDPSQAAEMIDRVLYNCLFAQKPVYIELPRNRVDAPIISVDTSLPSTAGSNPISLHEAAQEAAAMLKQATCPLLWLGHEIQRFGLQAVLLEFAERHHIPIVSSLLGKGVVDEMHPLYAGLYTGKISKPEVLKLVDHCDCALSLGLIMSDVDTGIFTAKFNTDTQIMANHTLLQIKHHQYPDVYFQDFIRHLCSMDLGKQFRVDMPPYAETLHTTFIPAPNKKITTAEVFKCLQSHLNEGHLVVADIGDSLFGSSELVLSKNSFLSCAYFATLGFAVPGALGAQLAEPVKRAVAIVGDGAFQMTGMELSTAVRYQLDPIVLLLNNHGYTTERPLIEGKYNDIVDWNYTELTRLLGGGIGIKVSTEQELERALQAAFSRRGTFYLIEVELDKTDYSPFLRRFGELAEKKT